MRIISGVIATPDVFVLLVTTLAGTVSLGELLFELHSVNPLMTIKIKMPIITTRNYRKHRISNRVRIKKH